MRILIVESDSRLAALWTSHLCAVGREIVLAATEDAAIDHLRQTDFDAVVLDLCPNEIQRLTVSDYAYLVQPEAPVFLMVQATVFTDGSLFRLCRNARATLPRSMPPSDLVATVEHYARAV